MSLYGAMFSGVSGLGAQSQALGVISDNISNVNTTGYKATSSRFSTMVTQQSLPNSYAPGGVLFNRQSLVDHQGLLQSTGSATDVAVAGNGLFIVQGTTSATSTDPYFYTRAGSFSPDQDGFLKNTAGYYLMGWATDATGTPLAANTSALTSLEPVNVSGVSGNATPTTTVDIGANLPATAAVGDDFVTNVQIFDSLGVTHDLAFTWTKSALNQWNLSIQPPSGSATVVVDDAAGAPYAAAGRLDFDAQPADTNTIVIGGTTYEFESAGGVTAGNTAVAIGADVATTVANLVAAVGNARVTASGSTVNILQSAAGTALAVNPIGTPNIAQSATGAFTIPALTAATPAVTFSGVLGTPSGFNVASLDVTGWESGAGNSTVAVNLGTAGVGNGLTQFSGAYSIGFINQNGVQFGSFSGVNISEEGVVIALFDNGETQPIYKIPVATFANPNGLSAKTGNVYLTSDTTGVPILREAKSSGAGTIASGALENSTVDLGTEFTNMIIAQRAYSAATKIITTADDMLDELVRIKR
jgi:flagellar hook protein FlgE